MSFEQFMSEQIEAIESSGMEAADWIEQHAEKFRAEHLVDE